MMGAFNCTCNTFYQGNGFDCKGSHIGQMHLYIELFVNSELLRRLVPLDLLHTLLSLSLVSDLVIGFTTAAAFFLLALLTVGGCITAHVWRTMQARKNLVRQLTTRNLA